MEILKKVGYGALIWVIMFVWVTLLMFIFNLEAGWLMYILTWIGAAIVVWFATGMSKPKSLVDGLILGVIFIAVGLLMDWLITTKFNGEIFKSWNLWVGYAITLMIPVLRGSMNK